MGRDVCGYLSLLALLPRHLRVLDTPLAVCSLIHSLKNFSLPVSGLVPDLVSELPLESLLLRAPIHACRLKPCDLEFGARTEIQLRCLAIFRRQPIPMGPQLTAGL